MEEAITNKEYLNSHAYGASLWKRTWEKLPHTSYLVKYELGKDKYSVLMTDLCYLYGETLDKNEIEERFQSLNPHVTMQEKILINYLRKSLEDLNEAGKSKDASWKEKCNFKRTPKELSFTLCFKIGEIECVFDMMPKLLSSEEFHLHIVSQSIMTAQLEIEENKRLKQLLAAADKSKDISASLQDKKGRLNYSFPIPANDVMNSFLAIQDTVSECLSTLIGKQSSTENINDNASPKKQCTLKVEQVKHQPEKRKLEEGTIKTEQMKVAPSLDGEEMREQPSTSHIPKKKPKKKIFRI